MTKKQAIIPENTEVASPANADQGRNRNLFIKVDTFDDNNKEIGTRIVDMYHFGTRNWLQNHHWWAMHNGHTVVTEIATAEAVEVHMAAQREALAAKYNDAALPRVQAA